MLRESMVFPEFFSAEHSGSKLLIGIFNSCRDSNMKTHDLLLTIKAEAQKSWKSVEELNKMIFFSLPQTKQYKKKQMSKPNKPKTQNK